MSLLKKCVRCKKLLFFRYKEKENLFYCEDCMIEKESEDKALEEKRKFLAEKKKRKKLLNDIQADKELKQELELEKQKLAEKQRKREQKLLKKEKKEPEMKPARKQRQVKTEYFSMHEIEEYEHLLYIEATLKRLLVIDWLNGKKKVVLNKQREIRRTHAGGFSAEKFQKFVDHKKKTTLDWIISLLEKPGVIRKPYDIIRVRSTDENLKSEIENYIEKIY